MPMLGVHSEGIYFCVEGCRQMSFWWAWVGRIIAVASLIKLLSGTFKFGLSTVLQNAIALYQEIVYPLVSPIVWLFEQFNIMLNKDALIFLIVFIGLFFRSTSITYVQMEQVKEREKLATDEGMRELINHLNEGREPYQNLAKFAGLFIGVFALVCYLKDFTTAVL